MPALMPDKPGDIVAKPEPSVANMIARFKSAKDGDALDKPKAPAAPAPAARTVESEPAPAASPPKAPDPKPVDKSIVPKLEPMPDKPKAPETPPPPKEPVATEPLPEKLSHKNFKAIVEARDEFKTKYEAAEKRAKEIEAKLQEQSTRPSPELEETRRELEEYRQREKQFNLERSPEFRKAFDTKIENAITDAKEAVDVSKAAELEEILRAPAGEWRNKRFKDFLTNLDDDLARGDLREAYGKLKSVQRERADELAKANENVKALDLLKAKQMEENAAREKELRARLLHVSLNEATRALPDFREGEDTTHNLAVAENKAMVQRMITENMSDEEFGRMAVLAVRGFRSLSLERQLTEKVAALEAEIAKLSSASPDLEGTGGGTDRTDKADTPDKMGARFMQATQGGIPGR